MVDKYFSENKLKYLNLLSRNYKNKDATIAKIIMLKSVLHMPKATEHFVSDIHGEYDAFYHVINNASGVIKNYIIELFDEEIDENEKAELATVIYYPEEKIKQLRSIGKVDDKWLNDTLIRLIKMTRRVGAKYNREKIVSAFPDDISNVLSELIFESPMNRHKRDYYNTLLSEIINMNVADRYLEELSKLIKRFAVEHLHVIGDIYDRGDSPDKIMDFLINHHDADIQFGNHDIVWYGAHNGSQALVANAIRIALRYNNISTIEDSYGINLLPLVSFSVETYADDKCERFLPKGKTAPEDIELISKMHKAITIIQFKAEAKVIRDNPQFEMDDRIQIDKLYDDNRYIDIDGEKFEMADTNFPTLENGIEYTEKEKEVIEKLTESFMNSPKLREHMRFMATKGNMYKISNDNLLFHGSIPLDDDGNFKETKFTGKILSGKELLDELDKIIKDSFYSNNEHLKKYYNDILWYLWCGPDSPLFGKTKMTTFERYFIMDKKTHEEPKTSYYKYRDDEEIIDMILKEFNIYSEIGKIINGHVPVKATRGENPIKANGKLISIDGGFSKAYQSTTGIAGYTLISNSYGLILATHEAIPDDKDVISDNFDITSKTEFALKYKSRRKTYDSDLGEKIKEKISDLEDLVTAYETGQIKENL